MNWLKLSWKNLTHRPLNLSLSLILFALGVGLISLLFLLEKQLQDNFEKNLAKVDLVIGAKGSPLQLILSSMYHIDAPTGNISLDEIRPFLNKRHPLIQDFVPLSLGDSYKGFRIVGTANNFVEWYEGVIANGTLWSKNFEVTLGADVAAQLNLNIGDQFNSSHGFTDDEGLEHDDAESFRVVGILEKSGSVMDQLILTTPQSFWLVHDHDHTAVVEGNENEEADQANHDHDNDGHQDHNHTDHDNLADAAAPGQTPKLLIDEDGDKQITSLLIRFKGRNFQALNMQRSINENTDMQAATPAIEINRLFSMMNSGEQALRILALVIIIVSGLSIFISLFSSLSDRKYELALMRVMGAGPGKLFFLIILEGLIVAVLGYIIGIILSHGGMEIIGKVMKENYRYNFTGMEFLKQEWLLLIGAIAIGFIAAIIPAMQASRTDISETLSQA